MQSDRDVRFWAKICKDDQNGCWIWIGAKRGQRQKRGCFWNGKKNVDAARWIWERLYGEVGEGRVIMHLCDSPLCVNPTHLKAGTQCENVADMWAKGRANLEGIRQGAAKGRALLAARPELRARGERHGIHQRNQRGEANPQATLTNEAVRQIRELAGDMPQRAIAARFGVHQAIVWRIINRKAWTHV